MNISSLVVNVDPRKVEAALASLAGSGLCDVFFHDREKGTVVVTIEGKDVGEEMDKMKAIERLPHVLSAALVYAYSENELEEARRKLAAASEAVPDALRDR
jgi:nitrate reductase NapD